MKVVGIDGRTYTWNVLKDHKRKNPSSLHLRARNLLKKMFPMTAVQEELILPGTGFNSLTCDFFLPTYLLMVEVQGEQHSKYTPHFHGAGTVGNWNFARAKKRDRMKEEWCSINDIDLVQLPFNESDEEWRERIERR